MFELRRSALRHTCALALLGTLIAAAHPARAQESTAAQAPERHTLRFTYTKDMVTWHRMSTEMSMKMDMFGQKIDNEVSLKLTMQTKVVDVLPTGSAKLERTVKRLQTRISNPMMEEQVYDSDIKDADAGLMGDMAILVGVKLTMEMDPRGQIKNLKFPADLEDKLSGQMSVEDLEQMFSKESIVLPEQPVAVGEVWKNSSEMPLGGGMGAVAIHQENKLLSIAGGIAVVEQMVSFGESQEIDSPLGGKMKVTGEPAKGSIELNLKTGSAEKTSTVMKMNMNGSGMNMDIQMNLVLQRIEEPKPSGTAGGEKDGEKASKSDG